MTFSEEVSRSGDRPGARLTAGTVKRDSSTGDLQVTVEGVPMAAAWLDGLVLSPGDTVVVATMRAREGQSSALVLGKSHNKPRPGEGQVTEVPASSPTISVSADGETYSARFLATYTPVVGDNVMLLWQGSMPVVLGEVGVVPAPPPPDVPEPTPDAPPEPKESGVESYPSTDTGTFDVGNGVWSRYYGSHIMQGTSSGYTSQGTWFYGNAPTTLSGRTITRFRFKIPSRRHAGNYNSSLTLHFYLHNHRTRAGAPPRVAGPHDVSIPPRYAGGWVDLPVGWGQAIADSGGGISIYGDPYGGVTGRYEDPSSGQLELHWTR